MYTVIDADTFHLIVLVPALLSSNRTDPRAYACISYSKTRIHRHNSFFHVLSWLFWFRFVSVLFLFVRRCFFYPTFGDGLDLTRPDLTGLDLARLQQSGASQREPAVAPVPFVPEERTVTQLVEMGFDREHVFMALRATETNRVEVAMEYILTHPPPTPGEEMKVSVSYGHILRDHFLLVLYVRTFRGAVFVSVLFLPDVVCTQSVRCETQVSEISWEVRGILFGGERERAGEVLHGNAGYSC